VPGSPVGTDDESIQCPRCRVVFSADPVVAVAELPIAKAARPSSPTKSDPVAISECRTLLMGNVRLLSLPADLEGLRSNAAYETLSHSGQTPCPKNNTGGIAFSSLPGFESTAPEAPENIPGFRIDGVIGHGGMGSVYLARQLSLDRPVALKVMSKTWASDAVFVARFIREAYAAAQLNHTNVVQIYDIGETQGLRYFSMEYVVGSSLADVLKKRGKLEPEVAVGYILQAARGLKHAHERGIIHRDIKPDNLLLDEQGTVKVADLGLVKTPDLTKFQDRLVESDNDYGLSGLHAIPSNMTGVRMALGTPAYMAPEQCRDASTVDHRADIYSLGCTLYALVTGKQPFQAKSAFSLMKKHAYEALIPPEQFNARLPKEVSAVIQKMMAKHPADRYANVADVIAILEQWLGVQSTGARFTPRDDQMAEVERLAAEFRNAPTAILRQGLISAAVSGSALLAVLLLFFGQVQWAFGLAGLVLQSALAYFFLNGYSKQTYLFRRLKQFVAGMSGGDWIVAAGAAGLFIAFLWMSKLLILWAGFGLIAAAIAGGVWYLLDRKVNAERIANTTATKQLVKQLRREGATAEEIRLFVAKYSGRLWEEYFESAFSFEDKLSTRNLLLRGESAGAREKFAAWREPLVNLLNHIDSVRKNARERVLMERAELDRLIAAGVPLRQAKRSAEQRAEATIERGDALKLGEIPFGTSYGTQPSQSMICLGSELPRRDYLGIVADCVIGVPVRAVLAAVLIAASVLWCIQNELWHAQGMAGTEPLAINGIPANWTSWCDTANVGWGAMLLLASLFYRGQRMAVLATLGAGIAVFGHKLGIRTVEPIQDYHVAMLLGTVLALVGYRFGRR
jgi:serine/threonine protein kinase